MTSRNSTNELGQPCVRRSGVESGFADRAGTKWIGWPSISGTNFSNLFRRASGARQPKAVCQWWGGQLAPELGVTTRTIRNDVDRLRELEYPMDSATGVEGGYRMGVGAELPPLLLDNEEATAVALGLRTLAVGAITGIDDTTLR